MDQTFILLSQKKFRWTSWTIWWNFKKITLNLNQQQQYIALQFTDSSLDTNEGGKGKGEKKTYIGAHEIKHKNLAKENGAKCKKCR